MTPQIFLETLGAAATQLYREAGVFASVTLAQAALESGWLKKFPVDKYTGQVSYNAFGIKGSGPAGSVLYDSDEVVNGQRVTVEAQFRAYNNWYESMVDHHKFLATDRYAPVRRTATPEEAAEQLYACGYATDPEYPAKLTRIINQYNLKQYDTKEERKVIIVLDKGHGGTDSSGAYDPGACGNGLKEADVVDDICNRIAEKLTAYDVRVEFDPRTDSLSERAAFANNLGADYFCSIHINAGGGAGFESYVYTGAADDVERIQTILHSAVYGGFLAGQGVIDRGKKRANFAVLRLTNMPAILIECLFIDTAADAAKLKDDGFLNGLANEIAYGLATALSIPRKAVQEAAEATVAAAALDPVTIKVEGQELSGVIIDGTSYAPVRRMAEALGYNAGWDEASKTVTLTKSS